MRTSLLVALVAYLALFAGCGTPVSPDYLRHASIPWEGDGVERLGTSDKFELTVFREEELSGQYVVRPTGAINFPLIGRVAVDGRTCEEIESEISARLAAEFLRNPSVNCTVLEVNSRRFVVNGQVRRSGVYPFRPGITVVDAIATAGGIDETGDTRRVLVTRIVDGVPREIVVPYQRVISGAVPNLQLWPDDIVTVPVFRLIP